ncbi:hypothetical protein POPTR_006G092400v4 [Populus trichocarpa]|uniref:Uncharacterized protein n=1 Tax=Populus trichocarpa TaxID=3694 RepID=A0A3N7F5M3_POPTR|nr:uncharacterized protein LOC7454963 isoform X2 [Populus trichocarpa]KAI5584444.1 hypothetical protein BDE02_06G081800 [Populus trichocarpa]RQO91490.1 hypothetical protein POPTR_006G092400v4 [Populus trichocarpa]|eukprot:XP_006381223.1 uncharacterized protein LOC7454963 [Populus trichocarpa]
MEGKKQTGSSSSSFTSDLFGSKENSPSSMGIFGSIFAPASPKVLGRESLRFEVAEKKQDSADDAWNTKSGTPASDLTSKMNEGESQSVPNKDMSSIYQEQRVQPCHLSSSIYYGGQDIYHHPQTAHTSSINPMFKKDGPEDDTGSASRGNWWQGGLYY